jgi:phage-related protein
MSLPPGILADYIHLTDLIQHHGADLRMPHSRAMGDGLFELRPKGPEGIGRVFYCMQLGGSVVILHSFIKKTNATPVADLKLARKRLKEVKNG